MTPDTRRWMDAGIIALAVFAAASTSIDAGSPVRAVLVLLAFLLVPGWGVVSLLKSGPAAEMLGLTIGLSLAINIAAGLLLVWVVGGWQIGVPLIAAIVGSIAVALAATDLLRQAPSRRQAAAR
jgi:hypothetical protein